MLYKNKKMNISNTNDLCYIIIINNKWILIKKRYMIYKNKEWIIVIQMIYEL